MSISFRKVVVSAFAAAVSVCFSFGAEAEEEPEIIDLTAAVREAETADGAIYHIPTDNGNRGYVSGTWYTSSNLWDGVVSTVYLTPNYITPTFEYQILDTFRPGQDITVKSYSFQCVANQVAQRPMAWTLYGSVDDGVSWIVLDERTVTADDYVSSKVTVDLPNNRIACRLYKCVVSQNNGAANKIVRIAEVALWGTISEHADSILYTATPWAGNYDGFPHRIKVEVSHPANAEVSYSAVGEEGPYSAENPEFSDVGIHTVWFRISADGYEDVFDSADVAISNPQRRNLDLARTAMACGDQAYEISDTGDHDQTASAQAVFAGNSGRWYARAGGTLTFHFKDEFRPGEPIFIKSYTIVRGGKAEDGWFAPAFTLWGSKDGETWREVHKVTDCPTTPASVSFDVENNSSYRYYKFEFPSKIQLTSVRMFGNIGSGGGLLIFLK